MARIYGLPGPEPGDQLVFEVLHTLPDDWIIYAQPCLVHGSEVCKFKNIAAERDYVLQEIESLVVEDSLQAEK